MSTRLKDLQSQLQRDFNTNCEDCDLQIDETEMETHPLLRSIISGATGMLFGIALEKGRVFEPQVIRDQMLFKRFVMLKMFLSASTMGLICFSFLGSMPMTMRRMEAAVQTFSQSLSSKNLVGVILGGVLLGCGMTIAGACPGTVLVQLGAWVPNAWATVAGGLCGALFYALTDSTLTMIFKQKKKPKVYFLDRYLGVSYLNLAFPLSSVLALTVVGLEQYSPWHTEVSETLVTEGLMRAGAWPPFVAGMIIGSLQIPIVLANEDTLGSATSYVTLVSQIAPSKQSSYLDKYRSGMKNYWQVIYAGGAVLGSYISALASGTLGTVEGVSWYQGFGGGLLIIYGSRLAGGCTSGHGLSGMGLLALVSFAVVPAMFGGGIATALFMKYILQVEM